MVNGKAEVVPERDDRSAAGWYKTVQDEDDYQKTFERDRYDGLNQDQKGQFLTREFGRLEKARSELMMTPKGKNGNFTMWKIVAVFLIALLLGNLLGHSLGFGEDSQEGEKKEEAEE